MTAPSHYQWSTTRSLMCWTIDSAPPMSNGCQHETGRASQDQDFHRRDPTSSKLSLRVGKAGLGLRRICATTTRRLLSRSPWRLTHVAYWISYCVSESRSYHIWWTTKEERRAQSPASTARVLSSLSPFAVGISSHYLPLARSYHTYCTNIH